MKLKIVQLIILGIGLMLISCQGENTKSKIEVQSTSAEESEAVKKSAEKVIEETEVSENNATDESEPEDVEAEDVEESPDEDAGIPAEQIKKADDIIASVSEGDVFAVDTKKLFRMHCAICHGFKGNMMVNGAKDLTKSKIPLNQSVAQIYHGKGLMTPYKGVLRDEEIVALAKYVETFRN